MRAFRWPVLCAMTALAACNFGGTISDLVTGGTATHLTAATLLQAPTIPGLGGQPVTVVRLFFGTRPVGDVGFRAVNDATVEIADSLSGASALASQSGSGFYVSTSLDGGVGYDVGATYTFTITTNADSFVASGSAPAAEQVIQFQRIVPSPYPAQVFDTVGVGQSYTLTRSASPDASGQLPVAFVSVAAVTKPQQPTWTDAPTDATSILHLAINDVAWRSPSIVIPGTAFPSAGAYVITITAVERGNVDDRKLFSGSAVLIGSGVAGVVAAQ
jgi:hypothetical protein